MLNTIAEDILAITWIRRVHGGEQGFWKSSGSDRLPARLLLAVNPLAVHRGQAPRWRRHSRTTSDHVVTIIALWSSHDENPAPNHAEKCQSAVRRDND